MSARPPRPGPEGLVAYLAALHGQAPAGQLIELRYRRSGGGMAQRFFGVERPDAAAAAIVVLGRRQDLYVGAAPRARREGTRAALAPGWALWADCDGEAAAAAIERFEPAPAIVVRSGTGENRHGYWPLLEFEISDDLGHWRVEVPGKARGSAEALTGPTTPEGARVQVHNAPGAEVGPGQVATWATATEDEVEAFGFKWSWPGRSSKHFPFDWSGPDEE